MSTPTQKQLNEDTLFAFQMALKGHKQFEYYHYDAWMPISYVDSWYPHRIYHDIPEGWTRHDGEDWKGDGETDFEAVMFCSGRIETDAMDAKFWMRGESSFNHSDAEYRIYAYKLKAAWKLGNEVNGHKLPDGFTHNNNAGDNNYCPLPKDTKVEYIGKDRAQGKDKAGNLLWYNVIAYRVIEKKVIPWDFESAPHRAKVKRKTDGQIYKCSCHVDGAALHAGFNERALRVSYETLATDYLQLDGSVCGKEVEQ